MFRLNTARKSMSCLLWKAPKGTINPQTLGYVCPDGTINFVSNNSAMGYAKNVVLKALKSKTPYERGVVVKDNRIIANIKGNGNEVNFGKINMEDCVIVHGHPNSTPISIADYDCLMMDSAKEIIAFNPYGEYSKLIRHPESKFLNYFPKKIKKFIAKCIRDYKRGVAEYEYKEFMKSTDKALLNKFNIITQRIKDVYNKSDGNTKKELAYWLKKIDNDLVKDLSQIPSEYRTILKDLFELSKNEFKIKTPLTHKFWLENAEELGVKYETNFSNLI